MAEGQIPDGDRGLDALLRFDPLAAAERAAGSRLAADAGAAALGLLLADAHIDAKEVALRRASDTWSGMPFDERLAVYAGLGFEVVLDEPFAGAGGAAERFVVLWRGDGLLGSCESYGKWRSTNSSCVHYCWRPNSPDGDRFPRLVSSGCGTGDGSWRGDHDTREGLRRKLGGLGSEGRFVLPWAGNWPRPLGHLGTYAEWDNGAGRDRWNEVRHARFTRLPAAVREAIGGDSDA